MTDPCVPNPPSPFIARWARRLAHRFPAGARALDVECGHGRHVAVLVEAGYHVVGIDRRVDALQALMAASRDRAIRPALACADLERLPLPSTRFHLIVVSRYLDRTLFPALRNALVPGGVLLYETFTERQLRYARGPRSRMHLLKPGELRVLVHGFDVLFDEEVTAPDAVARIVARRRD
jgi:SAM-dependent methyltransferase